MFSRTTHVFKTFITFLFVTAVVFGLVVNSVPIATDSVVMAGDDAGQLIGGEVDPDGACGFAVAAVGAGLIGFAFATTAGIGAALLISLGAHAAAAICI